MSTRLITEEFARFKLPKVRISAPGCPFGSLRQAQRVRYFGNSLPKSCKGKVTNEVIYLNALDESKYNIAHAEAKYDQKTGEILEEEVEARIISQPGLVVKMMFILWI